VRDRHGPRTTRAKRLAEKLLQIRIALGLSQPKMVKRLGVEMPYRNISRYERDQSEPPMNMLLAYARVANARLREDSR